LHPTLKNVAKTTSRGSVAIAAGLFLLVERMDTMTEWTDFEWYDPESDKGGFEQFNEHMKRDHGFIEVAPPKDAGAIVIFPGPDGKVDMIDAVERLYGIKHDKGDRIIRIRGGEIVSDEVVE
jgi:hypothetical protein